MSTAEARIDEIADCAFTGEKVAERIAQYARLNQMLAHDVARALATAEEAAVAAMLQLKGHPLLAGVDVRWRARRVARVLREARELCKGVSAESVAFNMQFRNELAHLLRTERDVKTKEYRGKVTF